MSKKTFVTFSSKMPNPMFPHVFDVTCEEVLEKMDNVYLVDVRRPDEYVGELGHVPGAKLLTLDQLPQHTSELPKDGTIVFICRSGGRSAQATALAKERGIENAVNMQGGMIAWNDRNFQTES